MKTHYYWPVTIAADVFQNWWNSVTTHLVSLIMKISLCLNNDWVIISGDFTPLLTIYQQDMSANSIKWLFWIWRRNATHKKKQQDRMWKSVSKYHYEDWFIHKKKTIPKSNADMIIVT